MEKSFITSGIVLSSHHVPVKSPRFMVKLVKLTKFDPKKMWKSPDEKWRKMSTFSSLAANSNAWRLVSFSPMVVLLDGKMSTYFTKIYWVGLKILAFCPRISMAIDICLTDFLYQYSWNDAPKASPKHGFDDWEKSKDTGFSWVEKIGERYRRPMKIGQSPTPETAWLVQISGPQTDVSEKLKQLKPPKENINKHCLKNNNHHQSGIIIPPGSENNEYVKSIIESDYQILLTIHIF